MNTFARCAVLVGGLMSFFCGHLSASQAPLPMPVVRVSAPTDPVAALQQEIITQMQEVDALSSKQVLQKADLARLQASGASEEARADAQAFIDALDKRISDAREVLAAMHAQMKDLVEQVPS